MLFRRSVDAALLLLAAPASGTGIGGIGREAGARFTADAGVALVIKRDQRDIVTTGIDPNVLCGPFRQRADLTDGLTARQSEVVDLPQRGPALRLLATQAGEPERIDIQRTEEWLDLGNSTTTAGI